MGTFILRIDFLLLCIVFFIPDKFPCFEICFLWNWDSCLLLIYVSIVYFSPYLLLIYICLYVKSGFLIDDVLLGLVGTPWWLGHLDFLTLKVFHGKPKAIHQLQFRFSYPGTVFYGGLYSWFSTPLSHTSLYSQNGNF